MDWSSPAKKKPGKQLSRRISLRRFGFLPSQTTSESSPSSRSREPSFMYKMTLGSRVSAAVRLPPRWRNCSDESSGMVKSVYHPTLLHYEVTLTQDLDIQGATELVEGVIGNIRQRADQLVARRRDGLLGIFDRASFDADLSHALGKAKRRVALAMADIDHFKQVNDTYGHPTGDAVLRAIAQVLSDRCPRNTTLYRYGGEELAAI